VSRAGRALRWLAGATLVGSMAGGALIAQEINVRSQAMPSRVGEGEEVTLVVEVSGSSFDQVAPPDLSALDDFEVLGGPSRSSRFQWVNGQTSSSLTFSYVLKPRRVGSLTIPPLGLLVRGRTYRTRPVTVEVVGGRGGGTPPGGPANPPVGPGFGGRPSAPAEGRGEGAPGPDLRVRAEVDARTAYVGQQLTVRFLLDTQTEVLNLQLKESPSFPGFWVEEIKLPENLDMKRVQIGTEVYNEYTLMKRALFPTSGGTLTIPPVTYQIQVRRRSRDPMESFFFAPTETLLRRTDPIPITVEPLPSPKPPGFSGAVGNFTLAVSADRKESQVNDAVGVKVRISGEGNLNALSASPLPELSDFKQYPPKITSSTSLQGDRLRGEKTWDYVLIPLAPGTQSVPPVVLSFFDPKAAQYRSVSSQPLTIQVAKGDQGPGAPLVTGMAQSDIKPLRRDIHYIKMAPNGLSDRSRPVYRSPFYAAALLLPLLLDLGLFVYIRRQDLSRANRRSRRERRAGARAHRALKEARRRMGPATARAYYAAVAQALTEYLADKFDTSAVGLTHQRIEELLVSRGASEELRSRYHRCLEACDYARFAPTSAGHAEMLRTLQEAEGILTNLERCVAA
jgi:oxygen tolerance protein BatD